MFCGPVILELCAFGLQIYLEVFTSPAREIIDNYGFRFTRHALHLSWGKHWKVWQYKNQWSSIGTKRSIPLTPATKDENE